MYNPLVFPLCESPIPARIAPKDFPEKLPEDPPKPDEIYQLLAVWSNVIEINSISAFEWGGEQRSDYMLWTTDEQRQFRVIWHPEQENFLTSERTKPL